MVDQYTGLFLVFFSKRGGAHSLLCHFGTRVHLERKHFLSRGMMGSSADQSERGWAVTPAAAAAAASVCECVLGWVCVGEGGVKSGQPLCCCE